MAYYSCGCQINQINDVRIVNQKLFCLKKGYNSANTLLTMSPKSFAPSNAMVLLPVRFRCNSIKIIRSTSVTYIFQTARTPPTLGCSLLRNNMHLPKSMVLLPIGFSLIRATAYEDLSGYTSVQPCFQTTVSFQILK